MLIFFDDTVLINGTPPRLRWHDQAVQCGWRVIRGIGLISCVYVNGETAVLGHRIDRMTQTVMGRAVRPCDCDAQWWRTSKVTLHNSVDG